MGVAGANGSDGGARKTGTLSSAGNADKGANGGDASASTSLTTTSAAAATGSGAGGAAGGGTNLGGAATTTQIGIGSTTPFMQGGSGGAGGIAGKQASPDNAYSLIF
jgi:hypothetical protein